MQRRQFCKALGLTATTCLAATTATGCKGGIESLVASNVHSDPAGDPATYQVLSDASVKGFGYDVDVLIVGSGIAGLSAAIAPAREGLKVLVVEKQTLYGGESYDSYGIVRVSGSNYQMSHEAATTTQAAWDAHKADKRFENVKDKDLVKRLFFSASEWVDLLINEYQAEFALPEEQAKLNVPINYLFPASGVGNMEGVLDSLLEGLKRQKVEFTNAYAATSFILDKEQAVSGVRFASTKDGSYLDVRAKRIIMATGGFSSNQSMVQEYAPNQMKVKSLTFASNGEGLKMLSAAGAQLSDMELVLPMIGDVPQVSAWGLFGPTLVLNSNGERFANEDDPLAAPLACVKEDGCYWWTVFDNQVCEGFLSSGIAETLSKYSKRTVGPCESLEELAEAMHVNEDVLDKTFSAYEERVSAGSDTTFGRRLFLRKLKAPFYAIQQMPSRFKTFGGIEVDANFQPLSSEGEKLKKVFCCGALISSCGDGLSACGTSGYLAGCAAVASLKE